MGFFSSVLGSVAGPVLGGILGGSGGQKTTTPATGYYSLPPELQNLYKDVLGQSKDILLPNGKINTAAFTPMPLGTGEQAALDKLAQGFTPTAESLQSDLSMLMNPYDQYVINDINREAAGQNSLVNQAATLAGQQGSNRSFLGTSDVEQNRLNNIGRFRQDQYNRSIDTIMNNLVPNRRQDASGALSGGTYARELDYQTKQAPFNALNATTGALGNFATGMQGNQAQTVKTSASIADILRGIQGGAQLGSQLGGFFGSLGF